MLQKTPQFTKNREISYFLNYTLQQFQGGFFSGGVGTQFATEGTGKVLFSALKKVPEELSLYIAYAVKTSDLHSSEGAI